MKAFGGGRLFSSMLAAALVAACGGGGGGVGGSVAPPPPPPAASGTSTVVVGAITGFGSIFVNGIEFETTDATFTVDDNPGVESDLALGQVVRITGTVDDNGTTGSADDVTFDNSIEGPIESIDVANGQIVVLGQTITVDTDTVFDDSFTNSSLNDLEIGDAIEVSGFDDAVGVIRASRIEPAEDTSEVEVHGVVASLDDSAHTFQLASLVVDYSGATLEDFASGAPADGDAVEVHGSSFGANGELIATRVQREDGGFDDVAGQDVQVEVEGLITRFASASDFDVAGQAVATNANTTFENGAAGDLALDVKVEAEGTVDANGVLQASKVSIRRENDARVAALVEAVDAAAGTLTVFGIPVTVDALTRFDDHSDADLRDFALSDVSVGDFVEVRGAESPDDAIVAAELRREDSDEEPSVQGGVDDFSAEASLTILGVVVQVDGQTQYRDAADQPLTAAEFFAAIAVGTSVKARGEQTGDGVLVASEVELEPED
jgi:hypothetical protein